MHIDFMKVLEMTKYRNVISLFKGCTALAYSKESEPVSHLVSITKSESKLHMLGGVVDDQMFTPQELHQCAQLLSLLTQHLTLSRTLTMVQSSLTNSLQHNQQRLSGLIEQIGKL